MDADLLRLLRDQYPFPIAYACKKMFGRLDNDAEKFKYLTDAAETVVQFLALVTLAQLAHDLHQQQALPLGDIAARLRNKLRTPAFGTWQGILRDVLKSYCDHRHLLVMPELFDFYFAPSRGKRLRIKPVISRAFDPLNSLRNTHTHDKLPAFPAYRIAEMIAAGMPWLEQVLSELQFLSNYRLAFVQDIRVRHPTRHSRLFSHTWYT